MTCTKCGNELPKEAKFCSLCGTPALEEMKTPRFCMYCGKSVDADTQFCEHCGQKIAPAETTPEAESESPDLNELISSLSQEDTPAVTQNAAPVSSPTAAPAAAPAAAAPVSSSITAPAAAPVAATPVSSSITAPATAPVAAAPVASAVGAEVVRAAGKAATKSVSSAGKIAKTIAIWTAVVAFVIGLASACLSHFVSSPEDTMDTLFSSVESLDYETMLNCLDSNTGSQFRAILGITGDLFGSITGIGIDFEDLLALAPSMGAYLDTPEIGDYEVETVLYTDYSAAKIQQICQQANNGGSIASGYVSDNAIISFLSEYHITLPGLENLLAETAIVKLTDASGATEYIPMVNEGMGDWRILMPDLMGSFLE